MLQADSKHRCRHCQQQTSPTAGDDAGTAEQDNRREDRQGCPQYVEMTAAPEDVCAEECRQRQNDAERAAESGVRPAYAAHAAE